MGDTTAEVRPKPTNRPRVSPPSIRDKTQPIGRQHPTQQAGPQQAENNSSRARATPTNRPAPQRLALRPDQMGGAPCIRGLRIPVATVIGMVAEGMGDPEVLAAYPDLQAEDIREAMRYAAEAVRERELPLAATG